MSIEVVLVHPNAVLPTRVTDGSVGYDLTIIKECENPPKTECKNLTFYDTCVKVKPPSGYYLEIHARSSLMKLGYKLANSVGIIDPDYRGNVLIGLTKFDQSMPDLIIGNGLRVAQLILRRIEIADCISVEKIDDTVRGTGGFGSTGGNLFGGGFGTRYQLVSNPPLAQPPDQPTIQPSIQPLNWDEAILKLKIENKK